MEQKKKKKIFFIAIAIVFLVMLGCVLFTTGAISFSSKVINIDPDRYYPVTYVVDGDTFKAGIEGKVITVRLLGINTPETVDPRKSVECYGKEASDESKGLLIGKKVKLAFNPNREKLDKYGRYLLYVYREDGLFINEYLVKEGFAREYTYGSLYMFQSQFKADESQAMTEKKGLWGSCV